MGRVYRWLGPDERRLIAARLAEGASMSGLAVQFGCHPVTIARIRRRGCCCVGGLGIRRVGCRLRSASGSSSGSRVASLIARSRGRWGGIARRSGGRFAGVVGGAGTIGRWRLSGVR